MEKDGKVGGTEPGQILEGTIKGQMLEGTIVIIMIIRANPERDNYDYMTLFIDCIGNRWLFCFSSDKKPDFLGSKRFSPSGPSLPAISDKMTDLERRPHRGAFNRHCLRSSKSKIGI